MHGAPARRDDIKITRPRPPAVESLIYIKDRICAAAILVSVLNCSNKDE
jgi:hypothetical protein